MYTYAQLTQAVLDNSADPSDTFKNNITDFIRKAELMVFRDADLRAWRQHAFVQSTPGKNYLTLPTNLAGTASGMEIIIRDLYVIGLDGTFNFMQTKNLSWLRDYWSNNIRRSIPKFYSHWNTSTINVAPPPDQPYFIEIEYSALPTSITDGGLTVQQATSGTIVAGGVGYSVNDVLTPSTGSVFLTGTQTKLTVNSVTGGGAITSFTVTTAGQYNVAPISPVPVTGGTGSGATFALTYGNTNSSLTWLSMNGWDSLLAGAMIWAQGMMKGEAASSGDTLQGVPGQWSTQYQEAIKRLQLTEARERQDDFRNRAPT